MRHVLFLALVVAAPATAQEPLVTDRPDFTESASVVGAGRFQLEGGTTYSRADGEGEIAVGELLLRIGLGSRLEGRVAGNSHVWSDAEDGFEDPVVGAKLLLAEGAAILASASVPIGSEGVGGDASEPEVRLAYAREAGSLSVGANVGWFWTEVADERRHGGLASLAFGIPLGPRDAAFVEAYGLATEGAGGEEVTIDGGLTRQLSDDFQLDARVGIGIGGDEASDWFFGVGAARRW